MSRAQGANAQLLLKKESVYGTSPSGNFAKLPFKEFDYGADQKLIDDDTIGHGREMIDPARDVIDVKHSGTIPADLNNIGTWLNLLLGAPTDTGTTPHYVHTFVSGSTALPSASAEIGFTDIGQYFLKTGLMVSSMEFDFAPSGMTDVSVDIIAQNEVRGTSSGGGTPTTAAYTRFSQFQGSITRNTVALAAITSAKLKLDNQMDAPHVIRADGLIEGIDPSLFKASLTIEALFEDATLFSDAESFTPAAISLGWTIDTNNSLIFNLPRVFLPRPTNKVQGPGGIKCTYSAQAVHDTVATYTLQAVLKNGIATY